MVERCVPAGPTVKAKHQAQKSDDREEKTVCVKNEMLEFKSSRAKRAYENRKKEEKKLSTFQEYKYRNIHTNVASRYMIVGDIEILEALTL